MLTVLVPALVGTSISHVLASAFAAGTGDGGMDGPNMHGTMWHPSLPPTTGRLIAIHLQPIPVLPTLAVAILVGYLLAVWLLHRRGVHWPLGRTLWWCAGVFSVLAMTATALDGYGMELFSAHMVQHMVLSMLTPIFFVLGAPMTLVLRVLPSGGGRWNARWLLLTLLHSRFARFMTHPAVTLSLFLMSLYGLYFTPVFDWLMSSMWGHNVMLIHFVLIGMLYFWSIVGIDPTPRRYSHGFRKFNPEVVRVLEIFVTTPFHAFFGIIVMMSTGLIVGFYANPIMGWNISPLSDQYTGGGLAWAFTEIPTILLLGALVVRWQQAEGRHERTIDRKAALDNDADLTAYNAYLTRMAGSDGAESQP